MSDVTDPTEPHAESPVTGPHDAPAPIPPEVVEAQYGEPEGAARAAVEPPPRPAAASFTTVDRRPQGRSGARVLVAIGFLLLFVAVAWEYVRQDHEAKLLASIARGQTQDPSRVEALEDALRAETTARTALGQDVATLKAAPHASDAAGTAPSPAADLEPLDARLRSLEQKVAATPAAAAAAASVPNDLATRLDDLTRKVAALSDDAKSAAQAPAAAPAPAVDLGPIEARLKAIEDKPAPAAPPAPVPDAALQARVSGIATQVDSLGKQLADAKRQAAAAQSGAEAAQTRANAILARAAATAALDAGRPLGSIPHAPPALSRFAVDPPPTEASLRLSYDAAAQRAQDASVPPTAGKRFGARVLTQIESLVTVSQGDHVLVGPPAATILAGAHEKLQAGDLAGAVATLGGLDPAARAAMTDWIDRAQGLLDARVALQTADLGAP